jgi:light-regulated signal transduction histidine kinase (bacteriophytochrome)
MQVDSYMGVTFFDASGKLLGILSVMHSDPIVDPEMAKMILEIFAKYAGSALERKKISDRLRTSHQNLETINEELRDFVHIASHDLQEPLRKIISFGDLIKLHSKAIDEKDIYYLQKIENSSRRLKNLIDDLVSFSTLDSYQIRKMEPVDLKDVVSQVLLDLEASIEKSGAKVKLFDLPVLEGNQFQLFHLFQNIISNSIKYCKKDEPPSIAIKGQAIDLPERGYKITIIDHGIGFDEKYLDRIFKPFQRLHHADEFEGTGMGLAICKKIVDQHGGMISANSKLQEGATFIIELPKKQEQMSD